MKRIMLLLTIFGAVLASSCEGPPGFDGIQGPPGPSGPSGSASEVFELRNVNFSLNANNEYTIYRQLNPVILLSDNILIYRLSGTIDPQTPIWQLIPRTLYLQQGELDYDFDFSLEDFTIYAGGTYNLATTPSYLNNQTFRIVILQGYLSNKKGGVAIEDYNAVMAAYHIDASHIKSIK